MIKDCVCGLAVHINGDIYSDLVSTVCTEWGAMSLSHEVLVLCQAPHTALPPLAGIEGPHLALHIQHCALYDVDDLYCYASSSAFKALHASTNTLLCINRFIVYSVHTSGMYTMT